VRATVARFSRSVVLPSLSNSQVRPFITDDTILNEKPEILAEALSKDDSEVVKAYHEFWTILLKPECAMLVQGMRNFLRNLQDTTEMETMASSMKMYLEGTYESFKSHVAWKDRVDPGVRRSLESYVYGHAQVHLERLEWSGLFPITDEQWSDRLEKLQFLNPTHLEIACLDNPTLDIDDILKGPMEALLSVDRYFSPFEKLQRILAVFQGVNATLSETLNKDASPIRKLPSADDILPTIILTTLKAKPTNIFRNLQFVDVYATSENLRGEAGYAYTNLYGAVQFLTDLDMEKPNFSISSEDFKKGIQECLTKTQQQITAAKEEDILDEPLISAEVSVQEVREGRLKGEEVDLEWALDRHENRLMEEASNGTKSKDDSVFAVKLPSGFNRTYSFLSTRPEDVRISDLSRLLEEYKMLAHVTEQLLGERAALQAAEKKRKAAERRNNVEDTLIGELTESRVRGLSLDE
jgi:hypothetical protein